MYAMWPKEVPWDEMLTKGVPWLPGQLPWDTCSWSRAFLLLLLLLFIGVAEILGRSLYTFSRLHIALG